MDRLHLPTLPRSIGRLPNTESRRLSSKYPSTDYDPRTWCVTCLGKKTFRWYTPDRPAVAEYDCDCQAQYQLTRWLMWSGIGLNFARLSWVDYVHITDAATSAAADFIQNRDAYASAGIGMTISGSHGNGKSLLAYLLLKELIEQGVLVYATTFVDMIESFSAGWRDDDQAKWFSARVRNAKVLYIDDLGRERKKGGDTNSVGENMLETVVRYRVSSSLPTIITTNLTQKQIAEGYGGPTMSLLTEKSIPVTITGADRRSQMKHRALDEVRCGLTRPVVLK